ncbi:ATP-binding cassette transporter sub-family A [Elysia marginata]|uniref:ATP-binding cassette transporter sub-family A n=1 Tax=Elysia marginata TaxID=1093978 RepID=A0AAV4IE76_9GAST|nr:ATP-binding cassette transporter sub-family A [Elysia marginata]
MQFCTHLKGIYGEELKREVSATVQEVGLEAKLNDLSQSLSGGQKRKLSVGIALIGGSKILVLDEPTSGMDPAARRQTWNVLQKARQGRTMVLSTHYMDEADVLGDRIAIMAEGVVKCCGSSMFLKKLYGAGYHLVVVKRPECNVDTLTKVVQTHIPTAELESVINTEVSYILPESESPLFPALFTELDDKKDELGLNSFGTSATTMEEVFLKVGESACDDDEGPLIIKGGEFRSKKVDAFERQGDDDDMARLTTPGADINGAGSNSSTECINMASEDVMAFNKGFLKKTGLSLKLSIMRGLFVKKVLHTWRNRVLTLLQLVLPVLFTIVALAPGQIGTPTKAVEPPLTLSVKPFGRTHIPVTAGVNATTNRTRFADIYADQFKFSQDVEPFTSPPDFNKYAAKRAGQLGTASYNKKMLIGLEMVEPEKPNAMAAVAFYNGLPYHGKGVSINYMMNALLQSTLNDTFSLQTILAPLPRETKDVGEDNAQSGLLSGFVIGFFMNVSMAFLTSTFIYFYIKERQVGSKHLQVVSGVGPVTYWVPSFLWDFINYIIPSLLVLIVFAAYSRPAFVADGRLGVVLFVFIMYGWAVLPCMYIIQFIFKSPPAGIVVVIFFSITSGLVTLLAVFFLKSPLFNTEKVGNALDWIFKVLFPNYNMASCFQNIETNYNNMIACENVDCKREISTCCKEMCERIGFCTTFEKNFMAWDSPGIGGSLFFMALQGVVFFTLVMLVEFHIIQKLWYYVSGLLFGSPRGANAVHQEAMISNEDSDVAAERQRINSLASSALSSEGQSVRSSGVPLQATIERDSTDSLILVNLYKRYRNLTAVDGICVGVPDQECFGLLGQNGAGKTTTFKMLTGDVIVTGGNAYLKGYDVRSNIKQVQANMGYCPQFDALIDQMTGRETLTMYARLRGVPEISIKTVVNSLMDILLLTPHADKLAGKYSGGNKRKLSTAMAIVGDPPFIMLDEPSCGMDPKARRQLWNVLSQVRASGRTLVLTSHSMEECDALCTRLAIMVNGRFVCMGSPQHLKNKFGQGYTLTVQLGVLSDGSTAPKEPLINFITENFPGSKVFDDHQGYIHFQVPDAGVKLAQVFSIMESTKANLCVQDYSVHQTTLEQVFLTFTKAQTAPKQTNPQ